MKRLFNKINRSAVVSFAVIPALVLSAGGAVVFAPRALAAACASPSTNYGAATVQITVESAGTYQIWSNMNTPGAPNDSYLLEVDGSTCYTVGDAGLNANQWKWVDYQNGNTGSKVRQSFTAGTHTLKMIGREPNVKLGRIMLVSDLNCVPTGTGDNCAVTGDVIAPTVDITSPVGGAEVANTVKVQADATDNTAVTKVEFLVGNSLKATDTSAPYSYDWDTKTVANGGATLQARAYDAAGNVATDSVQVTVKNGDSQAPSVPANVSAQADAYNKVTVRWSASTDNTEVTGYWLYRDGVAVAKLGKVTSYADNTVLANTNYTYRLSAFDAVGNTSALSAQASVKTPDAPDTTAPSAPQDLSAQAASSSQINLSWSASTDNIGVAAYDVYRASGGGSAAKVATVTTTSFGDSGLAASTEYAYYVVARDPAGNLSANSATVTLKTQDKPTPPVQSRKGSIKGKVTYAANRDRHAHVIINVGGNRYIYDTKRSGDYHLRNLPAKNYTVRFQAQGSFTTRQKVKIEPGKTTLVDVTLRSRR